MVNNSQQSFSKRPLVHLLSFIFLEPNRAYTRSIVYHDVLVAIRTPYIAKEFFKILSGLIKSTQKVNAFLDSPFLFPPFTYKFVRLKNKKDLPEIGKSFYNHKSIRTFYRLLSKTYTSIGIGSSFVKVSIA